MIILSIETSMRVCSAVVSDGVNILYSRRSETGSHAKDLPVFIDELLGCVHADGIQIEAVALSQGPGSYTGLRIGTALSKGLCYGLGVPLLAIDTLQVIASAVPAETLPDNVLLCPMIDARRMEVYCALYDKRLRRLTDIEAKVIDASSFAELLDRQPICFLGNGAEKCKGVIEHKNAIFADNIESEAENMRYLAEEAYKNRQMVDIAYFEPFYLKEFQATVSKKTEKILTHINANT